MSKYFITGNLGYIGPILSKFIKKMDTESEIIGFDNGYFLNCPVAAEIYSEKPFLDRQIFGDVRDQSKLKEFIHWADHIIHLAAISNDPMGMEFQKATKEINLESSIYLAKESIKSNAKSFIFASSCSVYGQGSNAPRSEVDEVNPLTEYAKSKIETEKSLEKLSLKSDHNITSLRFSTACGYSPNLRLDLVLNDFVVTALSNGSIDILSDGSPWRPLIDVEDMARAIFWACNRDTGKSFEILNIGSPEWNYQIKDLANSVRNILGRDIKINLNSKATPDKRSYRVCFDKFYSLAPKSMTPQLNLEESISRIVNVVKPYANRLSSNNRTHLIRLKVLKMLIEKKLVDKDLRWN